MLHSSCIDHINAASIYGAEQRRLYLSRAVIIARRPHRRLHAGAWPHMHGLTRALLIVRRRRRRRRNKCTASRNEIDDVIIHVTSGDVAKRRSFGRMDGQCTPPPPLMPRPPQPLRRAVRR